MPKYVIDFFAVQGEGKSGRMTEGRAQVEAESISAALAKVQENVSIPLSGCMVAEAKHAEALGIL